MTRELVCILCPVGCRLEVTAVEEGYSVQGNACRKGEGFAVEEMTNPVRTLTTTVRTSFPDVPVLPVKTDREIKKNALFTVMARVNCHLLTVPLECGAVVIPDVDGEGANLVATSDLLAGRSGGERLQVTGNMVE